MARTVEQIDADIRLLEEEREACILAQENAACAAVKAGLPPNWAETLTGFAREAFEGASFSQYGNARGELSPGILVRIEFDVFDPNEGEDEPGFEDDAIDEEPSHG